MRARIETEAAEKAAAAEAAEKKVRGSNIYIYMYIDMF